MVEAAAASVDGQCVALQQVAGGEGARSIGYKINTQIVAPGDDPPTGAVPAGSAVVGVGGSFSQAARKWVEGAAPSTIHETRH